MLVGLFDRMVYGARALDVCPVWAVSAILCAGRGFHIVADDRIFNYIPDRLAGDAELVL
jgi:hypothetical protein